MGGGVRVHHEIMSGGVRVHHHHDLVDLFIGWVHEECECFQFNSDMQLVVRGNVHQQYSDYNYCKK